MKEMKRKIVSWLCIVSMVAAYILSVPLNSNAADGDYNELTFSNWGFEAEEAVTASKSSSETPVTAWDNVAFSGSLKFYNNHGFDNDIIMLGGNEYNASGIWIKYYAPEKVVYFLKNGTEIAANFWGVEPDTAFDFRITFTPVDSDNLKVDFTIGSDTQSATMAKSVFADTGIRMYATSAGYYYKSTAKETEKDYTELTFSNWGFDTETASGTMWSSVEPITSWDNVKVSGSLKFNGGQDSLVFGANNNPEDWSGVKLEFYASAGMLWFGGNAITTSDPYGIYGIKTGEEYEFTLTFDANETGGQTVTLAINGNAYSLELSSKLSAYDILLYAPTGFTFKSITKEIEYKELTFRDWGIHTETITGTTWSTDKPITSWDKVKVSGTFKFNASNTNYSAISFGTDRSKNSSAGLQIQYYGQDSMLWFGGNGITTDPAALPIWNFPANTEVDFSLAFMTLKNGNLQATLTISTDAQPYVIEIAGSMGFDICAFANTNESFVIKSTVLEKELNDEVYNIENESYILTAASSVEVNGVSKNIGDVLNVAGDYRVKTISNSVVSERTVSLYILGDVDLDASTVAKDQSIALDNDDVTALKAILAGGTATAAQQKAGDLNNNGILDNTDLKLLQDIVAGTKTRADVLDKYYVDALSFEYLGGNEVMPIGGFYGPKAEHLTDQVFDDIKGAGINLITYSLIENFENTNAVLQQLKKAEEKGIGIFTLDSTINYMHADGNGNVTSHQPNTQLKTDSEIAALRGDYSYFDSYLGNYVMDEPTVPHTGLEEYQISEQNIRNYQFYTKVSQQLNKYANSFGYLNNAAATWFGEDGANSMTKSSLDEYKGIIKTITEETDAKMLSYDRYLKDLETIDNCDRYMVNLDVIRSQALKSEIPFWSIVQAGGTVEGQPNQIPTAEELYWQVNMNLAFGAKGITYFTLVQALNTAEPTSSGVLDVNYNKNTTEDRAWYNYVKNANEQIAAVDEILMKSKSLGVVTTSGYATANTKDIKLGEDSGTYNLEALIDYADIKSSDGVQRVEKISGGSGTYGVLAGAFDYQGKVALYVVNWDTTSSQNITVDFAGNNAYKYRVICAGQDVTGYGTSYTGNVAPGEAYLIVIEEEELDTTTQQFADINDIARFKKADGSYAAPELDGYVFAGWYSDANVAASDCDDYYVATSGKMPTSASSTEKNATITNLQNHSGALWAKYVDESVLSVKAQLANGTTSTQTTLTKMRLVTTVNSLNYANVGFNVATEANPEGTDVISTTVYSKIIANDANLSYTYAPNIFNSNSKYFGTLTLINLPVIQNGTDLADTKYIITPFWTTKDGTRVYGETRTLSVAMGLAAIAASN